MGPPGGPPGIPGERARDFKGTIKKLVSYLKPYRISILFVVILCAASTVFMIIGPKIMGNATTRLYEGVIAKLSNVPGAAIDFDYIGNAVLLLIGLYVAAAICNYVQGFIITNISMKITYDLRKQISQKINHLPLKYFDTRTYGEVLSRVTNDVDTISNTLNQSLSQIVMSVITIIGVLVMMFSISWVMTLVTFLILPISAVIISLVVKRSQKYFIRQQDYLGHVNGHVEEMYSGHNVMKAYNGEERSIREFDALNSELYSSAWKSFFFAGMMMPMMTFISNLGYVAISIMGGYMAITGQIKVGDILAFIQYVRTFTQPIMQTANIANIIQSTAAAAERVFEFLAEEEEIQETAQPVKLETIRGEVSFESIYFGYLPKKNIINNFSVSIKPGQKVAIVGPTGAGKTTMVKLLMRFYDVKQGAVRVDGVEIREFSRKDLRSIFGMVLQDTWLFNGTIMENIRYGRLNATDEEVIAAAKTAYVDHFIHALPGGYNMVLNEEANNISQGQKQLLTIARAVLADPKILILDEATSSVDTRTEVLIQKAMVRLMQDRTSFIIAHRLSTIRDADIILVMKDGEIIEQGSHRELMAANGFYTSLYNSQFEASTV
ncbi:MAG: ABC transporter ATP-binding protein [Dehalococcoidales bacterium]|nr:ABC transporter ATP-binding protein [Dehalococcoidales bacterium]